jgi:hypothetical protein
MNRACLLLALLSLSGCALWDETRARDGYIAATAQYRTCLGENAANPQACDGARASMLAAERLYSNL